MMRAQGTTQDRGRHVRISGVVLILLHVLAPLAFSQVANDAGGKFHISGTVVNNVTGQSLPGVRVFLSPVEARTEETVIITGADGRFRFDNLQAGKYGLGAAKPGFVRQGFAQHEGFSTAIAVGPTASADNLVFRLNPAAVISGQIVDEQNEPVRQAQVILFRSRLEDGAEKIRDVGQSESDDRGQYRFGGLEPGTYYLAVSARPWYAQYGIATQGEGPERGEATPSFDSTYPNTYYSGATDSSQATPLKIAAGDRVSADFSLTPVRAVHIRVHTPKLNANRGYGVLLTPLAFQGTSLRMPVSVQTATTRPGEIDITGLAPGSYRLQMVFPGKETTTYMQQIDAQGDMDVDASAIQSSSISGMVKVQGGTPLPGGSTIFLRSSSSGETAAASILPDGKFQFDPHQMLPPGSYEVGISTPDTFVLSLIASGTQVAGRNIQLRGAETIRLTVVVAEGVAAIKGTAVSDKDEKPFAGAMVLLVPDDLQHNTVLVRRDQSDSDGTFTLASVVPGRYTLVAIHNGWDLEWLDPAVLKSYLPGGVPVDVQKSGKYNLKVRVQ